MPVVDVSFVFTNPNHHVEMMVPVARELHRRGLTCQLVSLAEVRGLNSPTDLEIPLRRVIPYNVRRNPKVGSTIGHPSGKHRWIRSLAQQAVAFGLVPLVKRAIGKSRVVVIPNDAAFPYRELVTALRVPVVLMQEGVRFEFPSGDPYGTCGATIVCAWGDASAELFVERGVAPKAIRITGAPRLDGLDPAAWREPARELRSRLGITRPAIAYLSNPIETQGYGTRADKLELFRQFLVRSAELLRERDLAVLVKNHPNEDSAEYARIAATTPAGDRVRTAINTPLFAAVAAASAAVVLTSTVGIDALLFGLPLGSLEIPGHGFGFEYVERGAALGLHQASLAADLARLIDRTPNGAAAAFIDRHLKDRGRAALNVADVIAELG